VKIWKKRKKEKEKEKSMIWCHPIQNFTKMWKRKRKKANILLQYFENNAKIWEFLATFGLFFEVDSSFKMSSFAI
jgi:hypothetical protein